MKHNESVERDRQMTQFLLKNPGVQDTWEFGTVLNITKRSWDRQWWSLNYVCTYMFRAVSSNNRWKKESCNNKGNMTIGCKF